jgi:hypothetical protein
VTDDELRHFLKPKTHWGAIITVAIAVGGTVWGITQYLGDIPKRPEFHEVSNDVTRLRLDQEVMKGDVKAINIRLEEGFKSMNQKLDSTNDPKRRR